ncbi:MAG: cytochrome c oxidase assembly protein [Oleispira sp.]|nr:cytochrome c oxidase assembly protein [Oleispira sp.]
MMQINEPIKNKIDTRLLFKLVLFPCAMFGFGFLLIPLYDVFCDITGLNGKFDLINAQRVSAEKISEQQVDDAVDLISQQVILQFTTASDLTNIWQFKPDVSQLVIETGKQYKTVFHLRNPTGQVMEFTSIPSISPGLAAEYLIKTECFCFQKQILQPGEEVEMPLVFQLRQDIPKEFAKLTLAYRIYAKPLIELIN